MNGVGFFDSGEKNFTFIHPTDSEPRGNHIYTLSGILGWLGVCGAAWEREKTVKVDIPCWKQTDEALAS